MSSIQDLATYVGQHAAVLPALLAYSMASRQSLKTYLAVNAAPDAPPISEDDRKRMRRCHRFMALTFVALVLGVEFWLLGKQDEKALDIFFRVIMGFAYQAAFMGTLVDMTKAFSWAVFRSPGRMLHFRPARGTVSFPRVLASVAVATGLNAAAYFEVSPYVGSALAVALLYRTLSSAHRRTFSIRVVALFMLAWLALTFIFSAIVIFALMKNFKEAPNGDLVDEEGNVVIPADPEEIAFASPRVMSYINLIYPFLWAVGPGLLVAGCYRFDYANHVAENPAATSVVTFETIQPRAKFARFLGNGIIVPSAVPTNFYKPYFATALRSYFLAQVATFALFAAAVPLPADVFKTSAYDLMGLTLAIPFQVVGLAITATIRGEFRALWQYREVWTPKEGEEAEGGVVLAEDVEEQLPTYEADEKQALLPGAAVNESAPAYEVIEPVVKN
ncbi:hypothetical protein JCM10207_004213 [Rhodosporidiobolus poonsookiae]